MTIRARSRSRYRGMRCSGPTKWGAMSRIRTHPGSGASTRRRGPTGSRRLLVASSLIVALTASAAAGAGATTNATTQAPVTVHVLPATFHKGFERALNGVTSAEANAPKGYSYARGAQPPRRWARAARSQTAHCPTTAAPCSTRRTSTCCLGTELAVGLDAGCRASVYRALHAGTRRHFERHLVTDHGPVLRREWQRGFSSSVYVGAYQDSSVPPYDTSQAQLAAEDNAFVSAESVTDTADAQVVIVTSPGRAPTGSRQEVAPGATTIARGTPMPTRRTRTFRTSLTLDIRVARTQWPG